MEKLIQLKKTALRRHKQYILQNKIHHIKYLIFQLLKIFAFRSAQGRLVLCRNCSLSQFYIFSTALGSQTS